MRSSHFKPAWWLLNSHLQTIWPALFRASVRDIQLKRERIELPDGDFIDIDWLGKERNAPTILMLHGFEGSVNSHYAKGMMKAVHHCGWRAAFMHFRGCSGEPNRLPRGYHSGATEDVDYIAKRLIEHAPDFPMAAIGYSLGGNVLLKWLGETGASNPLAAAVAVSVPYELHKVAFRVQQGFSRLYQWYLLKCVCERLSRKPFYLSPPIDTSCFDDIKTVKEFDKNYTVPLHGFSSVDEYYNKTSSRQYLKKIEVPTLLVHAKDDPFMTEDVVPEKHELSSHVQLELTESGGHLGFVSGSYPWAASYWLEDRIPEFFRQYW